jgi:membrane protease YdiL (CAAX protease family)
MHQMGKENSWTSTESIVEVILGLVALGYFLIYPRNTLSDFIVCTGLCLLLMYGGAKIGLSKPAVTPFSSVDAILAIGSILLFLVIWIYGFMAGKLNMGSILNSLSITIVYFYYAWIQHFLAQRYLALRLWYFNQKFGDYVELRAAAMTGFIFGVLHIPYPNLMLPAALGGFGYAYYFLKTGRLWAVVTSHALVSSAGIFWLLDDNPFTELIELFY